MTLPNVTINNSDKPVPIQPENTNPAAEQTQEIKTIQKKEPLFLLGQTSYEKFLSKLYSRKIIDETGRLLIDLSKFQPSSNLLSQQIDTFLEKEIYLEAGDIDNFYKHLILAMKSLGVLDKHNKLTWGPNDLNVPTIVPVGKGSTIPYQQLYRVLLEQGIIDSIGYVKPIHITDSETSLPVIKLNRDQLLLQFLNNMPICVEIGDTLYCASSIKRKTFFQKIYSQMENLVHNIKYVGGVARQLIKESPLYCKEVFKQLFHYLGQEDIEDLITEDLFNPFEGGFVIDEDIRVYMLKAKEEALCKATQSVTKIIASIMFGDRHEEYLDWVKNNTYSKYNYISSGDHYSIASLKQPQIEFIFYEYLNRQKLFTDERQDDCTELVCGKDGGPINGPEEIQALTCNLGGIFHVDYADSVNIYGFSLTISRLTKGKMICNKDGFDILIDKMIRPTGHVKLTMPPVYSSRGDLGKIAFLIGNCLEKHHPNHLTNGAVAYTFTALSFLQQRLKPDKIAIICDCLDKAIAFNSVIPQSPILRVISECLFQRKIPFAIVNAAIQAACFMRLGFCCPCDQKNELSIVIREIENVAVVQLRMGKLGDNLSFWSPLDFHTSFENFFHYLTDPQTPVENYITIFKLVHELWKPSLTGKIEEPVLARYNACRHLDIQSLINAANTAMQNSNKFTHYLGWCMLLSLSGANPEESAVPSIVSSFWNIYFLQTDLQLRKLFRSQLKHILENTAYKDAITADDSLLCKFCANNDSAAAGQQELLLWIEALAESGEKDFCKVSYNLWTEHEGQLDPASSEFLSKKLFSHFVKHVPTLAKTLLERIQIGSNRFAFDNEMQAVGRLLFAYKQNPNQCVSLIALVKSFISRKRPEDIYISKDLEVLFTKQFVWLIDNLREQSHLDSCLALLKGVHKQVMLRKNIELISDQWFQICNVLETTEAYENWILAVSMYLWPSGEDPLNFVISLAAKISSGQNNEDKFEILLDHIAACPTTQASDCLKIQVPIMKLCKNMIDQAEYQKASNNIKSKFHKMLSETQTTNLWIYLCGAYCKAGCHREALEMWNKLYNLPPHNDYTKNLNNITGVLLEKLGNTINDTQGITFLSQMLLKKSIYIQNASKIIPLKTCIEKSLLPDMRVPFSLLQDLMTELLSLLTENPEEQKTDQRYASLLLLDFLSLSWKPNIVLTNTLLNHINTCFPALAIQMKQSDDHLELCSLLKQFKQYNMEINLSDDTSEICLWAINKALVSSRSDNGKLKEYIQLFTDLSTWLPSGFSEQQLLPTSKLIAAIFIEFQKRTSAHESALFFLQHRSLLLNVRPAAEWNEIITRIISELQALPQNKETVELAIKILDQQEILEPKLWSTCFDAASLQSDQNLLALAWSRFKLIATKYSSYKPSFEWAVSWHNALSHIAKTNHPDVPSFLDDALDHSSPFYLIFNGNESQSLKVKVWALIIESCLKQLKNKDAITVALKIANLRKDLGVLALSDKNLLTNVIPIDCEMLKSFFNIPNESLFLFVCDHTIGLLKLVKQSSLSQWKETVINIATDALEAGSQFEKSVKAESDQKQIIKTLLKLINILTEPDSPIDTFARQCAALVKYDAPLILDALHHLLLYMLNTPQKTGLGNPNNSEDIIVATNQATVALALNKYIHLDEPEFLTKARTILLNNQTVLKDLFGTQLLSAVWGNYLMKMLSSSYDQTDASSKYAFVTCLIVHLYLVAGDIKTEHICYEKMFSLAISMLDENNETMFIHLLDVIMTCIAVEFSNPKQLPPHHLGLPCVDYKEIEGTVIGYRMPPCTIGGLLTLVQNKGTNFSVSNYHCLQDKKTISDSAIPSFKQKFIQYAALLFKKLMDRTYSVEHMVHVHHFITTNLKNWMNQFAEFPGELVGIISQYVEWPPFESRFITLHESKATGLILDAYFKGFFKDNLGAVVKMLFYLRASDKLPSEFKNFKYQDAALKATELCYKESSISGSIRAIEIFTDVCKHYPETYKSLPLKKCVTTIINYSAPYMLSTVNECQTIAEHILVMLVQTTFDSDFFFMIIDKSLQVYRSNSFNDPAKTYNMLVFILHHLDNFKSLKGYKTYGNQIYQKLFKQLELIIPDIVNEISKCQIVDAANTLGKSFISIVITSGYPNYKKQKDELIINLFTALQKFNGELMLNVVHLMASHTLGLVAFDPSRARDKLLKDIEKNIKYVDKTNS